MKHMFYVICLLITSSFFILSASLYKSQVGQDQFLNEMYFKNKKNGVFIDIGAHDGMSLSNTWFFEKELGWRGICFEPLPTVFKQLVENRNCICINECVSADTVGTLLFREVTGYSQMLSGVETNYDPRHVARIEREITQMGGSSKLIEVSSCLLNSELEKYNFYRIDFLSLDIEGGELSILRSIDFDKFYICAITVENNYGTPEIRTFLESKGFLFITVLGDTDEIYINKKPYDHK
jgi:FkbM family methyltransferase